MANALNEFFVNIGKDMSEKLPTTEISHNQYLNANDSPEQSFFLYPTNPEEISKIVAAFSSNKPDGPDRIPIRFLSMECLH